MEAKRQDDVASRASSESSLAVSISQFLNDFDDDGHDDDDGIESTQRDASPGRRGRHPRVVGARDGEHYPADSNVRSAYPDAVGSRHLRGEALADEEHVLEKPSGPADMSAFRMFHEEGSTGTGVGASLRMGSSERGSSERGPHEPLAEGRNGSQREGLRREGGLNGSTAEKMRGLNSERRAQPGGALRFDAAAAVPAAAAAAGGGGGGGVGDGGGGGGGVGADSSVAGGTEENSGLRLSTRLVDSVTVKRMLSDLRFIKLQAMRSAMIDASNTAAFNGSWATIGIVSQKAKPKTSQSGRSFMSWRLTDLRRGDFAMFLFGRAYERHWKLSEGSVIAVFNAVFNPPQKGKDISFKVTAEDQVLFLGMSADYGVCKGETKSGARCNMVVNRSEGDFCSWHVGAAYKKFQTPRQELGGSNLGTSILYQPKKRWPRRVLAEVQGREEKKEKPAEMMGADRMQDLLKKNPFMTSKAHSQGKRFLMMASGMAPPKANSNFLDNVGEFSKKRNKENQCPQEGEKPSKFQKT